MDKLFTWLEIMKFWVTGIYLEPSDSIMDKMDFGEVLWNLHGRDGEKIYLTSILWLIMSTLLLDKLFGKTGVIGL